MGQFSISDSVLSKVFFGVFLISGVVHLYVFWMRIVPVLERLGHQFEPLSLRKYKNGFVTTLREYKRFQIAEKKPLTLWWTYWASLWTAILGWTAILLTVLLAG